jgi:spermidine synthase
MKLDYLEAVLGEFRQSPVNRQYSPICYFHGMLLSAAQWHPRLEVGLRAAAGVRPLSIGAGFAVVALIVLLFFWAGRERYRTAVATSVMVQGGSGMAVLLLLILGFQIQEGHAYRQLALIIALFMAGLAAGALWVARARCGWAEASRAVRWFARVQLSVTALPLVLLLYFSPVCEGLRDGLSSAAASWVFSALSLVAGCLGGAHFGLAALASTAAGARSEQAGGWLYALDLLGAAGGALAVSLLVLPLYGVSGTLLVLGAASLVCLLAVLRRQAASSTHARPST